MIHSQSAPFILIVSLVLLVLSGIVTLIWGRRLPRNGDWLVALFLAALAGSLIFAGNGLVEEGVHSRAWLRGWIWPVDAEGALTGGIIQDALGLVLAGLSVLFAAVLLGSRGLFSDPPRRERFYCAVAFAAAGTALCWVALTPWFAFVGLALVIFGGFIALGSRWESNEESRLAIRFGCERSFGLILSIFGTCGLAGGHAPLSWPANASTGDVWFAATSTLTVSELAGAVLLIAGLLIQLHPFPFLSWAVSSGRTAPWVRVSLTQVFPAWAALGVLLRLQAHLGAPFIFTIFGWLMMASTVLAVISGMLQSQWESALGAWVSAGATFSAAMLCLAGSQPALALMIGLGLGATAFACSKTEAAGPSIYSKMSGFAGICAATGVVGFVSAGGAVQWLVQSWRDPALAAAALSAFALFVMLGWKLGWTMNREPASRAPHWTAIAPPAILTLLALGILWTGSVSGGALPGGVDRVTASLMDLLFETKANADEANAATVFGAYCGALLLAIGAAYWTSIQIQEPEEEGFGKKLYRFIVSGYGTDLVATRFVGGLTWIAVRAQNLIDNRIWGSFIPNGFTSVIRVSAKTVSRADLVVSVQLRKLIRPCIDAPAKFLQLIQNGDVQWYLLFGVGSGLAILVHFLLSAGGA